MDIDVFDFDKTLYKGDSTFDFWVFNLKRRPWLLFLVPFQLVGFLPYALGVWTLGRAKEQFLSFLRFIDGERVVKEFWERYSYRLCDWFGQDFMERETVVATASPEFLVAPVCEGRGISRVFGTRADIKTGKIEGKNCKGQEKLVRIGEVYPNFRIIRAFSDDEKADLPMLEAAKEAFLVDNGEITPRK